MWLSESGGHYYNYAAGSVVPAAEGRRHQLTRRRRQRSDNDNITADNDYNMAAPAVMRRRPTAAAGDCSTEIHSHLRRSEPTHQRLPTVHRRQSAALGHRLRLSYAGLGYYWDGWPPSAVDIGLGYATPSPVTTGMGDRQPAALGHPGKQAEMGPIMNVQGFAGLGLTHRGLSWYASGLMSANVAYLGDVCLRLSYAEPGYYWDWWPSAVAYTVHSRQSAAVDPVIIT